MVVVHAKCHIQNLMVPYSFVYSEPDRVSVQAVGKC